MPCMPAHMRSLCSPVELTDWTPAGPFTFTKGLRTIRVEAVGGRMNPWRHGTPCSTSSRTRSSSRRWSTTRPS